MRQSIEQEDRALAASVRGGAISTGATRGATTRLRPDPPRPDPNSSLEGELSTTMQQREKIPVTRDGLKALKEEYDHLVNTRRPEITRAIAAAREEGDLRENAGYDAAKHDQGFIEGRIRELEEILRRVEVIDDIEQDGQSVRVGSTVTVDVDGAEETYTIVGAVEARPSAGRISNQSPFGRALLGHRVGDEVDIHTPAATLRARVLKIEG